jgi:hypothetical protein
MITLFSPRTVRSLPTPVTAPETAPENTTAPRNILLVIAGTLPIPAPGDAATTHAPLNNPPTDSSRLTPQPLNLQAYLPCLEQGLVEQMIVVDGSGQDLAPLQQQVEAYQSQVEVWSLGPISAAQDLHQAEAHLVNRVMEISPSLRQLAPQDFVWQVSAHAQLKNLPQLLQSQPSQGDLYCNQSWLARRLDLRVVRWNLRSYHALVKDWAQAFRTESPSPAEQVAYKRLNQLKMEHCRLAQAYLLPLGASLNTIGKLRTKPQFAQSPSRKLGQPRQIRQRDYWMSWRNQEIQGA